MEVGINIIIVIINIIIEIFALLLDFYNSVAGFQSPEAAGTYYYTIFIITA